MQLFRLRVVALAVGVAAAQSPSRAETINLTLLFACDTHKVVITSVRGGFARLRTAEKAGRAKEGHVVYADGGDLLSPSLLSSFDMGEHTIALTNMASPDIFFPGNHEFDFGQEVFLKRKACSVSIASSRT